MKHSLLQSVLACWLVACGSETHEADVGADSAYEMHTLGDAYALPDGDAQERECVAGRTRCEGRCVLLESHPEHCGQCGIRCEGENECVHARCAPAREPDPDRDAGRYASLQIDDEGRPHIAYLDESTPDEIALRYAYFDGMRWNTEAIDGGAVGSWLSLALDEGGSPLVSYYDHVDDALRVARRSLGAWEVESVAIGGRYTGLSASEGRVDVVHYDYTAEAIFHSAFDGERWFTRPVSDVGDSGKYASLARASDGALYVSFYQGNPSQLVFGEAHEDGWRLETVHEGPSLGQYTSLALDAAGAPCIAYYDAYQARLLFAHQTLDGWVRDVVDEDGDVGRFASLAFRGSTPIIAYYDASNEDLRVALRQDSGAWESRLLDERGDVGTNASLVVTEEHVHVAYFSASTKRLRYLRRAL